jgi:5,10-methylenetetrahydromethanopterin reductase
VLLAAAATATREIGLGTCILNPYSIHPAEIAMAAVTLQELSGGRFLLGLSAGADDFLAWAGIARKSPLRRVRDAVVAIRTLCAGGSPADISGSGPGWQAAARLRFPAMPTPIYLGAMSPRMLALIGEVADGGLPLLYPPESFGEVIAHVDEGLARSTRRRDEVDVAACVWVSVDDDPERARRPMAEKLAYYGASFAPGVLRRVGVDAEALTPLREADPAEAAALLPPAMLDLGICGTPHEVAERCRRLVADGATHVSFGPPLGPDRQRSLRLLGERVLPQLLG